MERRVKGIHQAHRGAGFLEAENTLAAMELGWSWGLAPEIDISTTRDGAIVGFHDKKLARVVRNLPKHFAKACVHDLDFADLAALDVGLPAGQPRSIPLIADVLARLRELPDARLYLDIKQVSFPELAKLVQEHGVADRIIFATNRDPWLAEWRALQPHGETLRWVWFDATPGKLAVTQAELAKLRTAGFPSITQLQLHLMPIQGVMLPAASEVQDLASELAQRGILFQAFPHSDDPAVYRHLRTIGVPSFATDYPHQLLAVLNEA